MSKLDYAPNFCEHVKTIYKYHFMKMSSYYITTTGPEWFLERCSMWIYLLSKPNTKVSPPDCSSGKFICKHDQQSQNFSWTFFSNVLTHLHNENNTFNKNIFCYFQIKWIFHPKYHFKCNNIFQQRLKTLSLQTHVMCVFSNLKGIHL